MSQYSLFDCLRHNPMFAHLDVYAFQVIESYLSFKALAPNEVLFDEGDRGDYVAVVVAGKLEIVKKIRHSRSHTEEGENTISTSTYSRHRRTSIIDNNMMVDDGLVTQLAIMKAGDSIGEMSIIDELPRSATVRALKKSGIIILPKKDFDLVLQEHPRIGINILKGIATMLSINLRRTSESLSQKSN